MEKLNILGLRPTLIGTDSCFYARNKMLKFWNVLWKHLNCIYCIYRFFHEHDGQNLSILQCSLKTPYKHISDTELGN